jgi:hypothetical protein
VTVWGGQQSIPPLRIHGTALGEMLTNPASWVKRRVEQITFVDEGTIRRRVSVDFELPSWYVDTGLPILYAPLALVRKRPLVNFDLRDENEAVLPLLGSTANQRVVIAALVTTAASVLKKHGLSLGVEVQRDLEGIARCDLAKADREIFDLFERRHSAGERRCLRRDPSTKGLMEDMAVNFPLLVGIDDPERRRVVKFSYLEELPHPPRSLRRTLGWSSSTFVFPLGGIGMSRTYHCELGAPEELDIQQAKLISFAGPQKKMTHHKTTEACGEWVHLRTARARPQSRGVLISHLRAPAAGMPTTSAFLALGVSILLTAGAVFHQRIADSAEAASAILLTLPAGIAAYLARPTHELSRRLLRGVRMLNWAIAILVFLAATTMTLGLKNDSDSFILVAWATLAAIAWVITLILGLSAVLPYLSRPPQMPDPADRGWYGV